MFIGFKRAFASAMQYRVVGTSLRHTILYTCDDPDLLLVDPKKPGYVSGKRPSPTISSLSDKRAQENVIFQRAMAAVEEANVDLFIPTESTSKAPRKKNATSESTLCTRCHSLQHHSAIPNAIEEDKASSFDIYSRIRQDPDAVVVNVIDIMDFPLSLLDLRKHIGTRPRIIHVFNRMDIIYKQPVSARAAKRRLLLLLESAVATGEEHDVRVISALKGWDVESLANSLRTRRRGTNIYFVGSANAGKSSLISTLGRRSKMPNLQLPVISHVPGTTLASIPTEIELFGDVLGRGRGSVVDLPGVLKPGFSSFIKPESLQSMLPHKHIKAVPMSLKKGESVILADLIRIDNISDEENHILITPYMQAKAHTTSRPEHIFAKSSEIRQTEIPPLEIAVEHELEVIKGGRNMLDLVFKDLGFVSVALWKGIAKIRVMTPGGLHCGHRQPALIDNSYDLV
ncbi:Putative uncharacterized protein [Taphrina deformans PYCC 5710]|uniref:G domain-containing protein n=1 Tax=Taphrina deformans (strain PYCC 5710 / ATCC 11124 / CBS 356.35 / IMI 108563 / JCM 9778 / NBRC 8474) TaxID=1097556 RepID=R4X938_TAPDE|nr:Putative uncharacterized protein [Taphrina deformans PYCC 5710]|eukprot:CCG81940.1 Putative uncharacterized protein [Taphrina deformans PYCC 5710]